MVKIAVVRCASVAKLVMQQGVSPIVSVGKIVHANLADVQGHP